MPEAGQEIIKHIDFPEYPEDNPAWIDIICNPGRQVFLDLKADNADDANAFILSRVIKDWNFTKAGVKLEITPANVTLALSMVDQGMALDAIGLASFLTDIKKNNSRSFSSPAKVAPPGNTTT